MAHITINQANLYYPISYDHHRSLKRRIVRTVSRGKIFSGDSTATHVHALKDISLTINAGDRVGLIGSNGAGKSTLLRMLAGLMLPDSGTVSIEGNVMPLFGTTGAMDPERTGYDNIFLSGRMLGIPPKKMRHHIADIEAFCELGAFLDMPVRTYSDGMRVRLGFAIATCANPEILLLDEAIGAGDAHFLDKATQRAQALYERAHIIVLASHAPSIHYQLCNKLVWLEHGQIVQIGAVDEVMTQYLKNSHGT